jgi:hypothetical protein
MGEWKRAVALRGMPTQAMRLHEWAPAACWEETDRILLF